MLRLGLYQRNLFRLLQLMKLDFIIKQVSLDMTKFIFLNLPKLTQIQLLQIIQKTYLCWNSTRKLIIGCFNEEYGLKIREVYEFNTFLLYVTTYKR